MFYVLGALGKKCSNITYWVGREKSNGKLISSLGGTVIIPSLVPLELDCLHLTSGSVITRCVTLGEVFSLSVPEFRHLCN